MEFKINKPIVHWTDEQIEQITKDLTAHLKSRYDDEVASVKILNFKSKDPDYHNVSTATYVIGLINREVTFATEVDGKYVSDQTIDQAFAKIRDYV